MANLEEDITTAIRRAIDIRIRQVTEEEIAKAQENISRRIREDLARLAIGVHQSYVIERGNREIIIRVQHGGKP